MLTPKQIKDLKQLIDDKITLFVAQNVSPDHLSSDERRVLKDAGIDVSKIKPEDTLIYQSFATGMLSGVIPKSALNSVSYNSFKDFIASDKMIPLNSYEKGVISSIERQTMASLRGIGERYKSRLEGQILTEERRYFEDTIRNNVKEGKAKKDSLRNISNNISKDFDVWGRDFDKIVQTMSHQAFTDGRTAFYERNYGEDFDYYYDVFAGACKICIANYLTAGIGSEPKVFKNGELPPPQVNYGVKQKDQVVTDAPRHPYCYDDQTEVFTSNGWKYFKDVDIKKDLFLSYHHEKGVEWNKAIQKIVEPYSGVVEHRSNKWFDLVTTPNHYHFGCNRSDNRRGDNKPKLIQSKDMLSEFKYQNGTEGWRGKKCSSVSLFRDFEFNTHDFCEFMGFWLSEGSVSYHKKKNFYEIKITQTKKKYYGDIQNVVQRIGNDFKAKKIYYGKEAIYIRYIDKNPFVEYLYNFGHANEKYVPCIIKALDKESIWIFLEAYIKGDGSIRRPRAKYKGNFKSSYSISTSSFRMMSDITELVLKIGKRPSFYLHEVAGKSNSFKNGTYVINNDVWVINILNRITSSSNSLDKKNIYYDGYIYDVELEKNHTLFVRRNGKSTFSGNCRCTKTIKPEGYVWDKEKKSFIPPKDIDRKVDRKSKVKIEFRGKDYEV